MDMGLQLFRMETIVAIEKRHIPGAGQAQSGVEGARRPLIGLMDNSQARVAALVTVKDGRAVIG